MKQDLTRGARAGIPIALGYLSVSFTFGLVAVSSGLTPLQACLISMTCLTSAGQFAGLDIMVMSGGFFEMALAQFIINLRYSLMSISLSQKADDSFSLPARFLVSFGVTDEIFAVSMAKNRSISKYYMAGIIGTAYMGWAGGTLAGALMGNILPGIVVDALGIAIYGMFLAIIIPPAREDGKILRVIIIAVSISVLIKYMPGLQRISSGFSIILCAVISAGGCAWFETRKKQGERVRGTMEKEMSEDE